VNPLSVPTVKTAPSAAAQALPVSLAPQAQAVEPKASPLQGLLENAPSAQEAAAQKDLSNAREDSRTNFNQAARLEAPSNPAVAAGTSDAAVAAPAQARLQPAPLKTSPAEQAVLDQITRKLGPTLGRGDAPILYSVLETVFNRLSAAQQKLFPADAVSINHIYIIDSPILNAFVYPMKSSGVRRSNNLVFITTGLLKKMIDPDPAQLKAGISRVAGILGHELAHPVDNLDAEGIQNNFGQQIGGQAQEIRADSEGAMIAKSAGYPADCVYESLKRLFGGRSSLGTLDSLSSTHPQDDLRLAMQRMLLTMDRYEKGGHTPSFPEDIPPALLSELSGIDKGATQGRFVPLADLPDALARMRKVLTEKSEDPHRDLEFNRLVLATDALLAQKGPTLSDADFSTFLEILTLLTRTDAPGIFDRAAMAARFTETEHSAEFRAYPAHEAS
jgi:hypothetical protein